ncbi:hypothetical protein [Kibdelosporangium philippinense]|uniref:hypothetical protein n=1 Tax=Kibdelosporangium philippinense TaxID=211113 RepID=UPI0036136F4E
MQDALKQKSARNGGHGVLERWTRCAGTVDTVCWNGGHGVLERWTRCAGTVDTVCWNGGHGVLERWTRRRWVMASADGVTGWMDIW